MQATMAYVYSHIRQEIPPELLELAFKPRTFATTVEERISAEVMEPLLLDINLLGGKRRDIFVRSSWRMDLPPVTDSGLIGTGVQGSYFVVPPEAREGVNITAVLGPSSTVSSGLPGAGINYGANGGYGNTVESSLVEMLNTRTFAQYPVMPEVSLEGTNIIRLYPEEFIDSVSIAVMLEYDLEYLNMNPSAIVALRKLGLCAVQRYIGTQLLVKVDETEVVAGMEIGIIKDLITQCREKGADYDALLIKMKGAMQYDSRTFARLARWAI
jgi:hypothetical protein